MSLSWFEWQSVCSDYLDDRLSPETKKRADEFLKTSKEESERQQRYRKIIAAVAAQPRVALPAALKQAPVSFTLPKLDPKTGKFRNTRWERTPWFVKTGIEGAGIALVILVVVTMVPKLRTLYERSLERRLDSFSLADFISGNSEEAIQEAASKIPMARGKVTTVAADGTTQEAVDDFGGEDGDSAEEEDEPPKGKERDIRVGNSEVWRFNLKTDSPHDVRPKVVHMLGELHVPSSTAGIGGIEAPGGIQFDIVVAQSIVPSIKAQLQRIAGASARQKGVPAVNDPLFQEIFTWYKVKSKRSIPAGKSRVVIWLSQI